MLLNYYLWLKALHIIAFTAWVAGLLYLPRLYVYHAQVAPGSEMSEMFKGMERRVLRSIINPAMGATLILGILLIVETHAGYPGNGGWFHAKVLLLIGMFGVHGMLAKYRKDFEQDRNTKSPKFFRILNEVPAVLMVIIVLLAVLKPF